MTGRDESIAVLYVEDDEAVAALTAERLEREDKTFDVTHVARATDGLARLRDGSFECVVSDYDMPGRDGIEFLEAVREGWPDLPFVLYTGEGSEAVASEAIAAGVTDYLQKSTGAEQYALLANRIRNAVERHRTERRARALERVRDVFRDVHQALLAAGTREEIERRTCEILSDAEPYRFAWIGAVDREDGVVEPRATAGLEADYLDAVEVPADATTDPVAGDGETARAPDEMGPTVRAVRDLELAVEQDVAGDPAYEPWRRAALDRGFRSTVAVPLVYEGTLYGVLNLYAGRPGAFDGRERDLLADLGDAVAHAIHRAELSARLHRRDRLVEHLPVGTCRADLADGEVIDANARFAEIVDAPSTEAVRGRPLGACLRNPDPDEDIVRTLRREAAPSDRDLRLETFAGDRIWASVSAVRTDDRLDVIVTDVTDRKERETDRRVFREAVEAAGHAIYFTDRGGTIEYVNPAFEAATGYAAEEAIGQNPRILKSGEHDREFYEDLWRTILDGAVWRNEIVNRTKDGDRAVVDQTIAPVEGPDGDLEYFVAVNADITDQRERERALQRQNERLEEFASVVSHDLRNPLNVAQGRLDFARESCDSDHFDAIERSLDRMEALIEDVLAIAREGDGRMDLEHVDLSGVGEDCWRHVETPNVTLDREAERTIVADRSRLRELLANLFRNSVEHGSASPDGDARRDAVEHGGEDVTVTVGDLEDGFYVADDGPGIPAEERAHVFDRGHSTAEDGTGFGLHIVERIAEEHGWSVRVTESETGGARFEFTDVEVVSPSDR